MNLRRSQARALIRLRRAVGGDNLRLTILAVVVGAVAGYAATGFRYAISGVQWLAFGETSERLITAAGALPWWQILLAPALGGLIVGLFIHFLMPSKRPLGVADVIEAARLRGGRMSLTQGMKASVANAASIGVGASVGREGPVVLLGAALGSWIAKRLNLSRALMMNLVGCGVAAGVSASFNAPIAGALFAMEVVVGHYQLRAFAPVVIASVTGTVISRAHFGDFPAFIKPTYEIASFWEFPAFGLLGIASAVAAMLLMASIMVVASQAPKIPGPRWALPAYAGLLVGAIGIFFPQVLGVGYETTDVALKGGFTLWILLALIVAKTAATALSLGSGFGGGIFSPSLVLGGLVGGAFGIIATSVFPELSSGRGAYTLVGMGAVAAATLGAPLSTILIVFEMTGDYSITVAIMVAVVISSLLTQSFLTQSFFAWQLSTRGITALTDLERRLMRETTMGGLMDTDYATIGPDTDLATVREALLTAPHGELFVVDEEGTLLGTLVFGDLHGFAFGDKPAEKEEDENFELRRAMRSDPPALAAGDDLEAAVNLFSQTMDAHIAVLENRGNKRLIGVVHQKDVITAYQRAHHQARAQERGED